MSGVFLDFLLKYRPRGGDAESGLTNDQQAQAILEKARSLLDDGYPGVAIIYSANEGQTHALAKAYAAGQYSAGISGANQAQVMQKMETDLGTPTWSDLQMKMRIAPITTIPYKSDPIAIIKSDLANVEQYLKDGWAVLGWMNQRTVGTSHPYAIGGGVAANLPAAVQSEIQDGLKALAAKYPAPN